ncbi:hypothetical protein LWF15_19320 [Kineosporia rhizophila]|uniref:VOC family protein n=1 Tax=Kineosporia rhizophila TaxID=84633 RepID=UPI001E46B2AB|nr:VOC family protein [Kineosporia rhizophila]MCE0537644.1 hypothetical protein [Kineosporia rhizophila]
MSGESIRGRLEAVVLDAADIEALAGFYASLTGWTIAESDAGWVTLRTREGFEVGLQAAPDHVPGPPSQFRLDLLVSDPAATAQQAERLGATRLEQTFGHITLADPAGHPFGLCCCSGVGEAAGLEAVVVDAPDAAALAAFYGRLLGVEVASGEPVLSPDRSFVVKFRQVEGYTAPQWPDPAHPQQAHLDIAVDDLDAGEAHALQAGATRVPGDQLTFRVFRDPAGHPFCLTDAG